MKLGPSDERTTKRKVPCPALQHAIDQGWLRDPQGAPNLVALLSSAHEAGLGLAQLHREGVIHGSLSPATCFLKAARNQRGFVVKVPSPPPPPPPLPRPAPPRAPPTPPAPPAPP